MKAGSIVLTSEPFAYVLKHTQRGRRCDMCFKKEENLRRCTKCMFVYYCGKDCQVKDWADHKAECGKLKKLVAAYESTHLMMTIDSVRLMAKIIRKLQNPSSITFEKSLNNQVRKFSDLMSHKENIKKDCSRMEMFQLIAEALKLFMGVKNMPTDEELLDIHGKIEINNFGIADDVLTTIGLGIYLSASALDHSCAANCSTVWNGLTLEVHLLEDVLEPSLQNLFVCYVEPLYTTEERRMTLKERYYFDCHCSRCEDEYRNELSTSIECLNSKCTEPVPIKADHCRKCKTPVGVEEKQLAVDIMSESGKLLKLMRFLREKRAIEEAFAIAEKQLERIKILHPLNSYVIRISDYASDIAMQLCMLQKSAQLGKLVLEGYRKYYVKYEPRIAIQLQQMASLYYECFYFGRALECLDEAEEIFRISHSVRHPVYQEVVRCRNMAAALVKRPTVR